MKYDKKFVSKIIFKIHFVNKLILLQLYVKYNFINLYIRFWIDVNGIFEWLKETSHIPWQSCSWCKFYALASAMNLYMQIHKHIYSYIYIYIFFSQYREIALEFSDYERGHPMTFLHICKIIQLPRFVSHTPVMFACLFIIALIFFSPLLL